MGSIWSIGLAGLCLLLSAPIPAQTPRNPALRPLPDRISDTEFWKLVSDLSEPDGTFQDDNFTSNETEFGQFVALLEASGRRGGAYIGVGPEQNFSYMVALRPEISFIVDIRRQAVIQHLMYKAIFELSADRADFISRLFSLPRPAGLDARSTIEDIWRAFLSAGHPDPARYAANLAAVKTHLTRTHRFALSAGDVSSLEYVSRAFVELGPMINYGGYAQGTVTSGTNFLKLTLAADSAGTLRSFLATEENFAVIKDAQRRNLIVPVTGDVSGPRALRGVGRYLKSRDAVVTAFYISNVEQYLFGLTPRGDVNDGWRKFYANVSTLPANASSIFIRMALGSTMTVTSGPDGRPQIATKPIVRFCPIPDFLAAVAAGHVETYGEALACGIR